MEYRTAIAGIYGLFASSIAKISGNRAYLQDTDNSVINKVRDGDHDAFGILVKRYDDFAFSLARGMAGNDESARDITQEAFLRAYRSIRRFEQRSSFKTWLYRIVYNTALAHISREKKAAERDNAAASELIDGSYTSMSKKLLVEKIISKLSPDYRAVIMLHYYEDMKYEEIADTLNCPIGTVKVRLYRAKYELKKLWSEYEIQL